MNESASKRLRLRFFAEDEQAVDQALSLTTHSSKSNVIRAALSFYDSIWASAREGFQILYRRADAEDQDVLAGAEVSTRHGRGERSRTETSIEIRITPADHERIEGLLAREAADTSSEIVRRAVRLYAAVAARRKEGWEVVAVSPSGDGLHVTVPGLGIGPMEKASVTAVRPAQPLARGPRCLDELLPRSLAAMVEQLAAKEGCPPEVLLIDLVRSEASARYHGLIREPVVVEPLEVAPAPEPVVAPEPPVPPAVAEAPQPQQAQEPAATSLIDEVLLSDLSQALDEMENQIEEIMQLLGESTRSEGQQELSDLFSSESDVPDHDDLDECETPLARLSARARTLNERLASLSSKVMLVPRKGKRARKAGETASPNCGLDGPPIAAGN